MTTSNVKRLADSSGVELEWSTRIFSSTSSHHRFVVFVILVILSSHNHHHHHHHLDQVIDHGRVAPTLEAFQCHVGPMRATSKGLMMVMTKISEL